MTFVELLAAVDSLVGRNVHVIVYARHAPVATLDGRLERGVRQDAGGGDVTAYAVGGATFALSDSQFVSAERAGSSMQVRLVDGVELMVFPWREE